MAKNILEEIEKVSDKVLKWVAAEYKYLEDFKRDLKDLTSHINDIKAGKKILRKAKKALRMVGRGERRTNGYTKNLEKDIKKLINQLPPNLKEEEENIEKQIEIAAKFLLKQGSIFVGNLKAQLMSIVTQYDLLKKSKNKNPKKQEEIKGNIKRTIDMLDNEVNEIDRWIGGLAAAVKKGKASVRRFAA